MVSSFKFSEYPQNIALLFSGGVDSTLLCYLLLKSIKEDQSNKVLTLYVLDRHNNPIEHSYRVLDLIKRKLSCTNIELKVLKIPKVENHLEVALATKLIEKKHDAILWGINQYPDDSSIRPNHIFNFVEGNKLKFPFAFIQKDEIIKMFYQLGIEDILPLTHSCGSDQATPCGTCFNCKERSWAYKSVGLTPHLGI